MKPRVGFGCVLAAICGCIGAGIIIYSRVTSPGAIVHDMPVPLTTNIPSARIYLNEGERLKVAMPNGSSREVRSLLNVLGPQTFGSFVWNDAGVAPGPVWARVDLAAQTISVFRGSDEIGTAVIVYGTSNKPTPIGWFAIKDKRRDYYSRSYDAPMPWMLRLTDDGVALHASRVRAGYATHGCIGTPAEFASKMFSAMNRGDQVIIIGAPK